MNNKSKFPEGKYFNEMPQYMLGYYTLMTIALMFLVILVDEHQFRKVFIKHDEDDEKYEQDVIDQYRASQINEVEEDDNEDESDLIISCRNLSKKRKGAKNDYIVKDISFCVKKGQIMGLLGPSGAGKSTIFKLLTLMSARDSGVLSLAGVEINRYWVDYRLTQDLNLGFVFQEDVLWEDKTVDENLEIIGKFRGLRNAIMK